MTPVRTLLAALALLPAAARAADGGETPDASEVRTTPAPAFTGVRGTVTDAKTGEALIEATVKVVKGAQKQALTDVDGTFELRLPPGTYDLRVFYELYEGRRINGVVVRQGEATVLPVALGGDETAVEEVVVEAKADTRKEAAVLQERRKAATVSDSISAQEIARTPDNNASDAVKRVVSATVVDGRYVLLRGLGGRYAQTLLNGVTLPSPEPDEQAVPLDLFPTALLSNLNVVKTYSAELPGTFAGGALLIETNAYPTKREWRLKLSLSGDSATTFGQMPTYQGGSRDWLGFDDGARSLPKGVEASRFLRRDAGSSRAELGEVGRQFPNRWSVSDSAALPNIGFGASTGDTVSLAGGKLGYLASLTYGHRTALQEATNALGQSSAAGVTVQPDSKSALRSATLGGLVNVGWQKGAHALNLFSLYTHAGDARTIVKDGYSETDTQHVYATRLFFEERALSFTQLSGTHKVPAVEGLQLGWQGNLSLTTRQEPDTRDLISRVTPDGARVYRSEVGSGVRFYSDLTDVSGGGSLGAALERGRLKLKAGALAQGSSRAFTARRIRFTHTANASPELYRLSPEEMFAPENIGTAFLPEEVTRPEDIYRASMLVAGGYATADLAPLEPLRIVAGVRYERAHQRLSFVDLGGGGAVEKTDRAQGDVLPALNVVWALGTSTNLRAGYSFTLARPQFRELAPFLYADFARSRNVSGNPELLDTRIHNADLRWEWFPGESEVVAASAFYKHFVHPIERRVVNSEGDLSFANAAGADNVGVELEARAGLGRLAAPLSTLKAGANVSLLSSRITLDGGGLGGLQTSRERPMQGQSPFVVNLGLTWTHPGRGPELSLLYNVAGRRIADVGFDQVPDTYELPLHRVDLALSQALGGGFRLKATATNLLDQPVVQQTGGRDVLRYRPGVAGGLSLEWAP